MKSSNILIADIDTRNFQRKLRAIAKHTEALADELDQIDRETCPECGGKEFVTVKAYGDNQEAIVISCACDECGYEMTVKGSAYD